MNITILRLKAFSNSTWSIWQMLHIVYGIQRQGSYKPWNPWSCSFEPECRILMLTWSLVPFLGQSIEVISKFDSCKDELTGYDSYSRGVTKGEPYRSLIFLVYNLEPSPFFALNSPSTAPEAALNSGDTLHIPVATCFLCSPRGGVQGEGYLGQLGEPWGALGKTGEY